MIVVDSVAALVPQIELDGDMNDQTIGAQARLMSKALRKLVEVSQKLILLFYLLIKFEKKLVLYMVILK